MIDYTSMYSNDLCYDETSPISSNSNNHDVRKVCNNNDTTYNYDYCYYC